MAPSRSRSGRRQTNPRPPRSRGVQCTVARPGLSAIAGALAVELAMAVMSHPLAADAPAEPTAEGPTGPLGQPPHMLRGQLTGFSQVGVLGAGAPRHVAAVAAGRAHRSRRTRAAGAEAFPLLTPSAPARTDGDAGQRLGPLHRLFPDGAGGLWAGGHVLHPRGLRAVAAGEPDGLGWAVELDRARASRCLALAPPAADPPGRTLFPACRAWPTQRRWRI